MELWLKTQGCGKTLYWILTLWSDFDAQWRTYRGWGFFVFLWLWWWSGVSVSSVILSKIRMNPKVKINRQGLLEERYPFAVNQRVKLKDKTLQEHRWCSLWSIGNLHLQAAWHPVHVVLSTCFQKRRKTTNQIQFYYKLGIESSCSKKGNVHTWTPAILVFLFPQLYTWMHDQGCSWKKASLYRCPDIILRLIYNVGVSKLWMADLSASFLRSLLGPSPLPRPAPGPAGPPRARGGPRSRRTPSALFSS